MLKRILYIHNGADLYGGGRFLLRLVSNLDRRFYQPFVIVPYDGPLSEALRIQKVEVAVMKSLPVISRRVFHSWRLFPFVLRIPFSAVVLALFIRRNKIDIVHTNTGSIPSAGLGARITRRPHLWHIHDSFHEFRKLWWFYSRYILWSSDRLVCVSQVIADQFSTKPGKLVVVYNGLPLDESDLIPASLLRTFREQFNLNDDRVVGVVGRIKFQRKGQDVFVKAISVLKQRVANVKYLIVGSPFPGNEDHLINLKKLIRQLGVDDVVILTGELEDVKIVYRILDILVLPSCFPEPFGTVVLEAMVNGVPVVGTRIGGTTEQIEDGVSGILVEPNDPSVLAEQIELLLNNHVLYHSIRKAALEWVRRLFSFEKMFNRLDGIYRELLNV